MARTGNNRQTGNGTRRVDGFSPPEASGFSTMTLDDSTLAVRSAFSNV